MFWFFFKEKSLEKRNILDNGDFLENYEIKYTNNLAFAISSHSYKYTKQNSIKFA